jgi:hypothetical protein
MPKDVAYRLLEHQTPEGWRPLAVAYRRGDRFVLSCPAWRGSNTLNVASLNDLGSEQFPSRGGWYRWTETRVCPTSVEWAGDLFRYAVGAGLPPPPPVPEDGGLFRGLWPLIPDSVFAAETPLAGALPFRASNPRPAQLPHPLENRAAWRVPWQRIHGRARAIVNLDVMDLTPRRPVASEEVPFIIDTGATVTIVSQSAFETCFRGKPIREGPVMAASGRELWARFFRAFVFSPIRRPGLPPLNFGELKIAVVDSQSWNLRCGVLGLDALRRVRMLSNEDNLFFFLLPNAPTGSGVEHQGIGKEVPPAEL